MYGVDKMFLMMEKQKNRGQDGAGYASIKFDLNPGQKYFYRVKELLGGKNTLDALKKEAAIWHEMTVIEEMMPVYLEYGLK